MALSRSCSSREMVVHIGTSGWSYAHWEEVLYPRDLPVRERLGVYVSSFATVELNDTVSLAALLA